MIERCLGYLKISPVSALFRTVIKAEWLNLLKFQAVAHLKKKKERKIKLCELFHRKQTPSS